MSEDSKKRESLDSPVQHEAQQLPIWAEWLQQNAEPKAEPPSLIELARRQIQEQRAAAPLPPEPAAPVNELGWGPAQDSLYRVLERLDPDNDSHWTSSGLPRLDALPGLIGRPVERSELNEARPGWCRARARQRRLEAASEAILNAAAALRAESTDGDHDLTFHRCLKERAERERAAHEALGPFKRFFPPPAPPHCPLQRRIAAQNRMARYRQDHRRPRR